MFTLYRRLDLSPRSAGDNVGTPTSQPATPSSMQAPLTAMSNVTNYIQIAPYKAGQFAPNNALNTPMLINTDSRTNSKSEPILLITAQAPLMINSQAPTTNGHYNGPTSNYKSGLLTTAVPHQISSEKSALTFTRSRIHIEDRDKVKLTDNPLYWDVEKLADFIRKTDCAHLADALIQHVSVYITQFLHNTVDP